MNGSIETSIFRCPRTNECFALEEVKRVFVL